MASRFETFPEDENCAIDEAVVQTNAKKATSLASRCSLVSCSVYYDMKKESNTFPLFFQKAFSQGSIGNLFYVNFMISEFSYLNISSIGRNLIQDENDCGYACLEIPSCFSYNVAAFPDVNGKLLCELLPSDKFNNSDKFNASKEFHHFYIPSPCDSSPCKNTGKCISLYKENGYKCICVKGFTGKDCETNINDCVNIPCLNNGTCIDLINGFNCSCPPGFAGNRCEIDINECESSPCLNNGTCTDRINAFNCSCPPGFSGNRCEIG
ncbi:uncharacterized protein [Porites lutea]|uniref:uncharacterized protein n=1 Tax=Porites lutea TaxID=51062 RepID=UPI003CC540F4